MGAGQDCGAGKMKDPTKYGITYGDNFVTDCCMTAPTCGKSPTCEAGFTADTAKENDICKSGTCSSSDCCKPDLTTCGGLSASGNLPSSATCNAAKEVIDPAKAGKAASKTDYRQKCR